MQVMQSVTRWIGRGAKLALPLLLLFVVLHTPARAQEGGNQAGLVVVHGDGRVVTRCVRFDEPQISGLTLLQRSGLTFAAEAGPMGATVCSLNGEGCPTSDCWCECHGTPCAYWIYFQGNPDGLLGLCQCWGGHAAARTRRRRCLDVGGHVVSPAAGKLRCYLRDRGSREHADSCPHGARRCTHDCTGRCGNADPKSQPDARGDGCPGEYSHTAGLRRHANSAADGDAHAAADCGYAGCFTDRCPGNGYCPLRSSADPHGPQRRVGSFRRAAAGAAKPFRLRGIRGHPGCGGRCLAAVAAQTR